MMNMEVLVMAISQILEMCATTSFNRRKIFEQCDLILKLSDYIEQQLSFDVFF